MEVSLEIISGALAGEKYPLQLTRKLQIGRGANADIAVAADPLLSERHFTFWWDETTCRIQDLESVRGTFLNGCRISEAAVRNGDKILAGQTQFVVRVKRDSGIRLFASASQPRGIAVAERNQLPTGESREPGGFTVALQINDE